MNKSKIYLTGLILLSGIKFANGSCAFVVSSNEDKVARYSVSNSNGLLTRLSPDISVSGGHSPTFVAVYNDGKNLLTVNNASNDLSLYKLDKQNCSVSYMKNIGSNGIAPTKILEIGKFVYVLNSADETVVQYQTSSDGSLSYVSTFALNMVGPSIYKADSLGKFLFAISTASNKISTLLVDSVTGKISLVNSSSRDTGVQPTVPKLDADYNHLILPSSQENKLYLYNYNSNTGLLTNYSSIDSHGVSPLGGNIINGYYYVSNQNSNQIAVFKSNNGKYEYLKNIDPGLNTPGLPSYSNGYVYMLSGPENKIGIFTINSSYGFTSVGSIATPNTPGYLLFID